MAQKGEDRKRNIETVHGPAWNKAITILAPFMDSSRARAMVMACMFQESNFTTRVQVSVVKGKVVDGPAHGFAQFEKGGACTGVLTHPTSKSYASKVCRAIGIPPTPQAVWDELRTNDVLAVAFARLLLLTDPRRLPEKDEHDYAWDYYERNWRPGKPRPEDWHANFDAAWSLEK